MNTPPELGPALRQLFSELSDGPVPGAAYVLNSGDVGLLRSLDQLSAADASRAVDGGATIAAHAQHVRFGLSLMNQWAASGGDPFSDARWDDAWRLSDVNESQWVEIRRGLREESDLARPPRRTAPAQCT